MSNDKFYAHSTNAHDKSDWQLLEKHLSEVAQLSSKFAKNFGAEKCGWLAGLLHDLGKYTNEFQDYLERSQRGEKVKRGKVIHALQGAKYIEKEINDHVIADIIGNVISSHHGGLFDNITDGERTLSLKTNKNEDVLHYAEAINEFSPLIEEAELKKEILFFCKKSQQRGFSLLFMLHLLTKIIYSSVVDADRCNSAGFKITDEIPDWLKLSQQLDDYLSGFSGTSDLDKIRSRISEQCRQGGGREPGIYTLSVPTGGGKTLSSLRFALEHANAHKFKRIIYVIPYLSILDQTAAKIHEIFTDENNELIFEHHSNIEPPEDDEEEEEYRLLSSRWDSPIILTTMVQFLETIYSNKASKLRKFHNMSETVLIFDEIQALPLKCMHLFNDAVNFLQTFSKSTILLCTATQPHLHKTERPVLLSDNPDIVSLTPDELKIFERVNIEDRTKTVMDYEQIAEVVKSQIMQGKSTLVILNTKSDAAGVYEKCKSIECEKAFLTTDLCSAHRLDILERLRKNLDPETKRITVCVSTQLIEAGVDISFDCVIRAEAGMDSIIQAAGRCNRNNENSIPQTVFVIDVKDERLSRLPEIKEGKNVTKTVFHEKQGTNLLSDEVINSFYNYYFYNQKDKFDYYAKNNKTTIYNLLDSNTLGTVAYKNHKNSNYTGLPCAFQTAAEEFSVIDGAQIGIVVYYGDSQKLINDFEHTNNLKEKIRILKQLQKYTVSVYSNSEKLKKLNESHAIRSVDDSFYLLNSEYYDANEMGLLLEANLPFLVV
ncbi:MAG: CRISPR-associated helicase Cas3' [Spirochaetes bacterium]|nr:CRISPR-associated helicase Cas3' [Spirochaetota bacterium]